MIADFFERYDDEDIEFIADFLYDGYYASSGSYDESDSQDYFYDDK